LGAAITSNTVSGGDRALDRAERAHAPPDAEVERQRAPNDQRVPTGADGDQRHDAAHDGIVGRARMRT
jgi:hypothetical protein